MGSVPPADRKKEILANQKNNSQNKRFDKYNRYELTVSVRVAMCVSLLPTTIYQPITPKYQQK